VDALENVLQRHHDRETFKLAGNLKGIAGLNPASD
jgi:hypothetical protein